MPRFELLIPFIFVLAAIFYVLLGLYAWRQRPAVAVIPFAWTMLSVSIWALMYALEVFLPTLPGKLFAVSLEYIGIACMPVFLFFYAFDYTGRGHLLTSRARALVWLIPSLTLLFAWTNPLHRWMWDSERIIPMGGLGILNVHFGNVFWFSTTFSYGLFTLAGSILIMDFLQRPGVYRLHISLVILAMLCSFAGTALFVFGISPIPYIDFTSLFFLPSAIGLAWVTLRYRLAEALTFEYLTVLKNMKESVIVLSHERRILYINPVAERMIGITEDLAIGQPFKQVAALFHQALEPCLDGDEHWKEIQVRAGKEAKTFEASVSLIALSNRAAKHTIISLHDITERKEKETELQRRGSIMAAINMAAEQFLRSQEWEKHIGEVLQSLGEAADVCRVQVIVNRRGEGDAIYSSLAYEWAAPGVEARLHNPAFQDVPLKTVNLERWANLLAAGRPIYGVVRDLPAHEADIFRQVGFLSLAAVPIFVESEWWGFLMFDECLREREWTGMELDAFLTAANIIGAAETRARSAKKLTRRQQALTLLQEIVTVSLQAASLKEMADITTDRLAELIGASGCFLTLWDDANQRTIPFAASGELQQSYPQTLIDPDERTFTKSALQLGRTLVIENVADTPYASPSVTGRFPSKSVIVLPLIAMQTKLGAALISFNDLHRFDAEEVQICEQAASLIALALEKFQAMDEAKRKAETSETLRRAGMAIAENLELDNAVNHVLDQLKKVVAYDSASVQLLEDDELVIIGGRGWENEADVLGMRFPLSADNPNSAVVETGKPHRLADARQSYKKFTEPPHDHIRSWLGVPLITQGKIIGLLAIDSAKPDDFQEREIALALEFANQVAVILENARKMQETKTQAITDALTGVYNRRGLYQLGEFEFQRARRIARPISAMMFDIDRFKQINDRHGHAVGDQVLHQLAQRCLKNSRATDMVGRYGGEEFVMLLAETNLEAARIIAERLRQGVMKAPFITDAGNITITSSIGVAEARSADTLETLIERADAALYRAKNSGRNRVIADE